MNFIVKTTAKGELLFHVEQDDIDDTPQAARALMDELCDAFEGFGEEDTSCEGRSHFEVED